MSSNPQPKPFFPPPPQPSPSKPDLPHRRGACAGSLLHSSSFSRVLSASASECATTSKRPRRLPRSSTASGSLSLPAPTRRPSASANQPRTSTPIPLTITRHPSAKASPKSSTFGSTIQAISPSPTSSPSRGPLQLSRFATRPSASSLLQKPPSNSFAKAPSS